MKTIIMAVMGGWLISSVVSAGTITVSTEAPTGVFASGSVDGPSFTRIFANGARPADMNEGRGNEIVPDTGSYAGGEMNALVIRKDTDQDFTGTTSTLTLYVFEGTKEMWDAGDGQGDGDLFDETGITTIYTETFALAGSYLEGDYVTLNLDTPITMGTRMNFFIKMDQGDSAETFFQIVQRSNPPAGVTAADGNQYQSVTADNKHVISPLEYYVVGTVPPPVFAITGITYDGGDVTLEVSGAANTTYSVKASATLVDGFPDYVGTVTTDGGGLGTFGPFAGVGSAEFYRLETQP